MKKYIYLLFAFIMLISFNSCIFVDLFIALGVELSEDEELESCYMNFVNNSNNKVWVAGMIIPSPSRPIKELGDTIFDTLAIVYPQSTRERVPLWDLPTYKEVSWTDFFRYYYIDSLTITVANTYEDISLWKTQKNDSLLLGKYVFTLQDLINGDPNTVTITYP